MYSYIHIHIMYTYYVFDVPINFEYVCARTTSHTYAGTLNNRLVWTGNDFSERLTNKIIIMNNYNKIFTLFT